MGVTAIAVLIVLLYIAIRRSATQERKANEREKLRLRAALDKESTEDREWRLRLSRSDHDVRSNPRA
jgi:hypothetical protein